MNLNFLNEQKNSTENWDMERQKGPFPTHLDINNKMLQNRIVNSMRGKNISIDFYLSCNK